VRLGEKALHGANTIDEKMQRSSILGDSMSKQNPYDRFLDGRPLETILAATPAAIDSVITKLGEEQAAVRPAPGKWSAAEIVCHLADCELVFGFRLRQTLAEDAPTVQPFDQDKWAATYAGISASHAFDVFKSLRAWNLMLIGGALPAAAGRIVTHPERGTMTFLTLVETMAGHDINHLGQLQRLSDAAGR
jgi:DinB superfamily